MKIIMIGQKGIPAHSGGVERHVDDLSRRLVQAGHEVIVYCRKNYSLNYNCVQEYFGVKLIYTPAIPSKHLGTVSHVFFSTLHALFQKGDIIHYHGIGPSLFAWIPRVFTPKVKVISTFHCQDYYHQKWGLLAKLVFHVGEWFACTVTNHTIVVSKYLQRFVATRYKRRALYIPNAVSLGERVKPSLITPYGLTTGNYILSVSRLVKHKGIHTIIEAYSALLKRHKNMPLLVIVGDSVFTDEYVASLKELAAGSDKILFLGEQQGAVLSELYSNARLFIQASQTEGLSYALLEAMSFGASVLVSDITENKEVLSAVGHTFKTGDIQDLAHQMNTLLFHSNVIRKSRTLNREYVKAHYNLDAAMGRVLGFYTKQLHTARRST